MGHAGTRGVEMYAMIGALNRRARGSDMNDVLE